MKEKIYILMNKDVEVLKFINLKSVLKDIYPLEVYRQDLLPYRMKNNVNLIDTWLR